MSLNDQLKSILFTSVRIKTRLVTDEVCFGTAFVIEYQSDDNTFPFLVTAKSLVEKAVEGRMVLVQSRGKEPLVSKNYVLDIDNFGKLWYPHPDYHLDVAITPFVPFVRHIENSGTPIFFQSFNMETLATNTDWGALQIGQKVMVLGYPVGFWDDKNYVPVVKPAHVISPPWISFRGSAQLLLNTSASEGWVGSPVVLLSENHDARSAPLLGMLNRVTSANSTDEDLKASETGDEFGMLIKSDVIVGAIVTYLREKGFI